jgi:hypothetical protein
MDKYMSLSKLDYSLSILSYPNWRIIRQSIVRDIKKDLSEAIVIKQIQIINAFMLELNPGIEFSQETKINLDFKLTSFMCFLIAHMPAL